MSTLPNDDYDGPNDDRDEAHAMESLGLTQFWLAELQVLHLELIVDHMKCDRIEEAKKHLNNYVEWMKRDIARQQHIEHLNDLIGEAEDKKKRDASGNGH